MKREAEQDKTFIANLKADAEYQQFHARLKVYNSSYNIGSTNCSLYMALNHLTLVPFLLDTLFEKDMSQSTRHSNLIKYLLNLNVLNTSASVSTSTSLISIRNHRE